MLRTELSDHEFAYMNVADTDGTTWDPYNLKIVAFSDVNPSNHYTISEAGVTHCIRRGKEEIAEFTPLEQWEKECGLFQEVRPRDGPHSDARTTTRTRARATRFIARTHPRGRHPTHPPDQCARAPAQRRARGGRRGLGADRPHGTATHTGSTPSAATETQRWAPSRAVGC
eukprot:883064-Prymnesium_polylepis.2